MRARRLHGALAMALTLLAAASSTHAAATTAPPEALNITHTPTTAPAVSPTYAPTTTPTEAPTEPSGIYIDKVESLEEDGSVSSKQLLGPMEGNTLLRIHLGNHPNVQKWHCKFTASSASDADATYLITYFHTSEAILKDDGTLSCRTPRFNATLAQVTILLNGYEQGGSKKSFYFDFFATILVSDLNTDSVQRFVADTGEYVDQFIKPHYYLKGPRGLAFGPQGDFYVASEQIDSVLMFDGSNGTYIKTFCQCNQPRALVFHYMDLFVVSRQDDTVYRYHHDTPQQYQYISGSQSRMTNPSGLVFDKYSSTAFVTSESSGNVFTYQMIGNTLPAGTTPGTDAHADSGRLQVQAQYDRVWSNMRVQSASGIDFTVDSVYVTGPSSGNAIVRFNRTTGEYIHHFEDDALNEPIDLKEYKDYMYVGSTHQIRKYNRLNGELIRVHSQLAGMVVTNFIFHTNWNHNKGE